MDWFEKKAYRKQKNGSLKSVRCELGKAPHEVSGALEYQSGELEKNHSGFFRG